MVPTRDGRHAAELPISPALPASHPLALAAQELEKVIPDHQWPERKLMAASALANNLNPWLPRRPCGSLCGSLFSALDHANIVRASSRLRKAALPGQIPYSAATIRTSLSVIEETIALMTGEQTFLIHSIEGNGHKDCGSNFAGSSKCLICIVSKGMPR